jgi:hypothetical protein
MRLDETIHDLMIDLQTANDTDITRIAEKLHQLRLHTAGDDRSLVIQAIQECRDLLTPAGILRRALTTRRESDAA